ncbi:MAG: hypothetical protein KKF44_08825 [Nanoarchaeota archaeon]|nr:hypothetical protein [Nanoarchaeota archaeon]
MTNAQVEHSPHAWEAIEEWNRWYESTGPLCDAGKAITKLLEFVYDPYGQRVPKIREFLDTGDYSLLQADVNKSTEHELHKLYGVGTLRDAFDVRNEYWTSQAPQRLEDRLRREPETQKDRFEESCSINDLQGAFSVLVWAHSSLELLKLVETEEKYMTKISKNLVEETRQGLEELIKEGKKLFSNGKPEKNGIKGKKPGIYFVQNFESASSFVEKYAQFNFLNVFEVVDKKATHLGHYTTVTENWDFEEKEINICIPISIGCPQGCGPCQIGYFDPSPFKDHIIPLTAEQSFRLLYKNELQNQETTELPFSPTSIKIYLLGGGDPGNNIYQFEKLIGKVKEFYDPSESKIAEWVLNNRQKDPDVDDDNFYQLIASTVGIRGGSVRRLINLGKRYPEFGLQFSVGAFNEDMRKQIIKAKNVIGIDDCAKAAAEFYDKTGRPGYLAIHPLEPLDDSQPSYLDGEQIADELDAIKKRTKINNLEEKVIITLTAIEDPPPDFDYRKPEKAVFESLRHALKQRNYQANIYDPPYDPQTGESCGTISKVAKEAVGLWGRHYNGWMS